MTPLRCPHCVAELQQQPEPRLAVCPKCRGAFCDVATLKAMAREAQKTLRPEFYRKPPLSGTAPIKYLPCPVCNELMNRHNFGQLSGVIVDVCVHHGVWFDDGELAQVLSFCSSGQLPDVEKLERFLRVGHQRPKVTPLDFKDTGTRAGREREAVDIVLDVLWSLLPLFP